MAIVKCEIESITMERNKAVKKICKAKAIVLIQLGSGARRYACKKHSDTGKIIKRFPAGSTHEDLGEK